MARLVIVSNRVPALARGSKAGGLAIALKDAVKPGTLWLGWSGRTAEASSLEASVTRHDGVDYATIDLSHDAYRNFYVGFANGTLWPLLHFRPGLMEFRREHLEGYRQANEIFAGVLVKLLRPDDLIWVHDYHLIPMASALRRMGVTNRIGFFLHIPFVPPCPTAPSCCGTFAPTMWPAFRPSSIATTSWTACAASSTSR